MYPDGTTADCTSADDGQWQLSYSINPRLLITNLAPSSSSAASCLRLTLLPPLLFQGECRKGSEGTARSRSQGEGENPISCTSGWASQAITSREHPASLSYFRSNPAATWFVGQQRGGRDQPPRAGENPIGAALGVVPGGKNGTHQIEASQRAAAGAHCTGYCHTS